MPERKGRKRRIVRDRTRGAGLPTDAAVIDAPTTSTKAARQAASNNGPLPSPFARATGVIIAVITAALATSMVYQALTGEASGIDAVARIVGGILLIIVAIVVGVLSAVPALVRDWFQRRR